MTGVCVCALLSNVLELLLWEILYSLIDNERRLNPLDTYTQSPFPCESGIYCKRTKHETS